MSKPKPKKIIEYRGRGGRKSATARVILRPGKGEITINGRTFVDYCCREMDRIYVLAPLRVLGIEGNFDIIARVNGGGVSGQAGALRHGITRALLEYDANYRPVLKENGFVTRDPREVERKKVGLKKARRATQFSKR